MKENLINQHTYYNNRFFDKWAWLYDYEKYFSFPLRRKAARFLNLKHHQKILDVATGTGAQAYELARLGYDVIGIDLSREMLKQAKKKCNFSLDLRFQQADATKLPYKDNYFDASTISLALHDMPYEIEILVLKEMERVTKKNGEILIVDYMEPKKHRMAKLTQPIVLLYETKNYAPFIRRGLKDILRNVGLTIDRETDFLGLVQIVIAKNRK